MTITATADQPESRRINPFLYWHWLWLEFGGVAVLGVAGVIARGYSVYDSQRG